MILDPILLPADMEALGSRASAYDRRRWESKRRERLAQRATTMALVNAVQFGNDLPVGAVAASQDNIVGRYGSSDQRLDSRQMHAEMMAITQTQLFGIYGVPPRSVAVNVEPCDNCQDFLAQPLQSGKKIEEVIFCITREELAERGLVKPHAEDIFTRARRLKLPYQIVQIRDPNIVFVNEVLFDHVQRDTATGEVIVDRAGLQNTLGDAFPSLRTLDIPA